MAINPYLANLLERIGPMLARMPQFQGQQIPPQGLFGPGMTPPVRRQMPTMPNTFTNFQPRRRFQGSGTMPMLDYSKLTPALNQAPAFVPPPSLPAPAPTPMAAPVAPVAPTYDTNGTMVAGNPFVGYQGGPMTAPQIAANSGWTPELGNLFAHNA